MGYPGMIVNVLSVLLALRPTELMAVIVSL
jgi:hypothetical protein